MDSKERSTSMAQQDKSQPKEKQDRGQPSQARGTAAAPYRGGAMMPGHRWEPFRRMRDEFNQLVNQFFGGWPSTWDAGRDWHWGLDVQENDANVMIRAEAPGFEPSDFDVEVRG